jgi:hypothetical protein
MSLLAKTNPTATRASVIWNAKLWGMLVAIAYGAICIWSPGWRELWWLKLPGVAAFGAAIGALMEWQLNDGIDLYWIVGEVEEEFGIKIPQFDWAEIETLDDLFKCILKNINSNCSSPTTVDFENATWIRLKSLLVNQLALIPDQVVKSARFYVEIPL